jgi:hypothetical protein
MGKISEFGKTKKGGSENAVKWGKNAVFAKEKVPKSYDFETLWWR